MKIPDDAAAGGNPHQAGDDPRLRAAMEELDRIEAFHRDLFGSSDKTGPPHAGTAAPPASATSARTDCLFRWGNLEVREEIGQGAFGEVYLAHDPTLSRDVALKLYKTDIQPGSHEQLGPGGFLHEARLMAKIHHRNVVAIHGADLLDGRIGLEMELIRGETLASILRRQVRLRADEAILLGIEICKALASLHERDIVHQDIKAENVMREVGGRVVLMDLGLGWQLSGSAYQGFSQGSPLYMPPEAFSGAKPMPCSDIYSVGVLLFHLVTGGWPAKADSLPDLIEMHRKGEYAPLLRLNADLPASFVTVIEKALAADPARRYRSAGEMAGALLACLEARPPAAARRGLPRWLGLTLAGAALAVAALAVAALALWEFRGNPSRPPHQAPDPRVASAEDARRTGDFFLCTGKYPEAVQWLTSARELLESAGAGQHPAMAGVLYDLGKVFQCMKEPADARAAFEQCLTLQRKIYKADARTPAATLVDLSEVCRVLGDESASERYFSEGSNMLGKEPAPAPADLVKPSTGSSAHRSSYTYTCTFEKWENKRPIPLQSGDPIHVGDMLTLAFQGSVPLYVYVVNRDQVGHEYALFPRPGCSPSNPLPADTVVRLPGSNGRGPVGWKANSPGGKERFLVVTSPTVIAEMEDLIASVPRPTENHDGSDVTLSPAASLCLRGFGGLGELAVDNAVGHDLASKGIEAYLQKSAVLSDSTERASGAAFRRFWLRNP